MAGNYLAKTAEEFLAALDQAGEKLQVFSQELSAKNEAVYSALARFEEANAEYRGTMGTREKSTAVDEALQKVIQGLQGAVHKWRVGIEASKKGQEFMHDHEKYLVVMIFGAVKSGKSTLGNFFAGREWLEAPFENVYKHRPPTEFATQEKGRNTGDIEKVDGRYWFSEGVTDTTGDIQYFTLSGLRWFDSPGTGALSKQGDKRNMEEMVREYLQYVDMCIFLVNSSEPGLMEDMKYMEQLSRTEQEALVVITKSDRVEEDVDEAGKIVKVYLPKTPEGRRLQEQDMCERLAAAYPQVDVDKFRAMSISTVLGDHAMRTGNEREFRDSQLDLLMQKLTEKARGDVVSLKTARPKKAMNKFLRDIVEGDEMIAGIKDLHNHVQTVLDSVEDYRGKVKQRTESLTDRITRRVKASALKETNRMAHQAEAGGKETEPATIAQMVFSVTQPILAEEINQEISKIIGMSQELVGDLEIKAAQPEIRAPGIKRQTKEFEQTYTVIEVVPRSPDGFVEHVQDILSLFNKKFYKKVKRKVTKKITVDAGVNVEDVIRELMPQIESYVARTARENLEKIADNYFAPPERFVQEIEKNLGRLHKELEALRF